MFPVTTKATPREPVYPSATLDTWHKRFCHIDIRKVQEMAKAETVRGLVIAKSVKANVHVCDGCLVGKTHKGPLNPSSDKREVSDVEKGKQAKDVLTLAFADIWGPARVVSLSGGSHLLAFVDNASRYVFGFVLKNLTAATVCEAVHKFYASATASSGRRLVVLRVDNGTSFKGVVSEFLRREGVHLQTTIPENSQQNGIVERCFRTIFGLVRAVMISAALPSRMWGYVALACIYCLNRVSPAGQENHISRYELFTGERPTVVNLKTIGVLVYAKVRDSDQVGKLGEKAYRGVFLGYHPAGVVVFIEKKNKVMEFRGGDVHVEEGCYPFRQTKVKEPSWKLDEEREEQDNRVEEERLVWSEVQPGHVEERKEVFQDDDDVIHAEHAFEPQDSVSAAAEPEPEPAKPERASVPEHPPLSSEIQIAKRYRFVDNSPPRVEAQEWTHRRQSVRIATQRSKAESTRLPRSPLRDRDRGGGGGGGGRGRGRGRVV